MQNHHQLTKELELGKLKIGQGNPILIQSMCNTDTRNIPATLAQIQQLADAGCQAVRLAVLNDDAASCLPVIQAQSPVALIADIHFDYRLAIAALEAGFAGLRINPGNIGKKENIRTLAKLANERQAIIRIGVNSGSLEKHLLQKYQKVCPEALVESALEHVKLLEDADFFNIKISLKSSSVLDSIAAYRLISEQTKYPLHLGVTEAGSLMRGAVKSALGIGILLAEGIGDTIRVSLTADPVEEIAVAQQILSSLNLAKFGPEIISCPTCGRTEIDLIKLSSQIEKHLKNSRKNIKVAIMGCVVNGPGEAKDADIGIAGGRDKAIIFKKGKIIRTESGYDKMLQAFIEELDKME